MIYIYIYIYIFIYMILSWEAVKTKQTANFHPRKKKEDASLLPQPVCLCTFVNMCARERESEQGIQAMNHTC
jgi:hypothetical protein